jgi:hypothetical protein
MTLARMPAGKPGQTRRMPSEAPSHSPCARDDRSDRAAANALHGDVLLGVVSIGAPFVLGFGDETAATISFVVMGVGELGTAFGTAWEAGDDIAGARPRPARHEPLSS